ncbi:MAG: AmmeMemoRadiSam system protein B [Candidatus Omnitrophica bacterium 4484_70.2]|nr:MAG: AmmeMemoRadiSam system protein B [Candidatus Omnitrophica bacterium 4484_70.2]
MKFLILYLFFLNLLFAQEVKNFEFAGSFYPEKKENLSSLIDNLFASIKVPHLEEKILGVISPHAGYIFSAGVAAYSFKILKDKKIDTAIIMGPSHRYYFKGVAAWDKGEFKVPLGNLKIDEEISQKIEELEFVKSRKEYFFKEHSIEVQLPFLIKSVNNIKIVPLIFGENTYQNLEKLAEKLKEIAEIKNIVVVVSTDLSHYHPYLEAKRIDAQTIKYIREKDANALWVDYKLGKARACGIYPLITFLLYVKKIGGKIKILKYANSGDTAGDRNRVVGYLSAVAYKKEEEAMGYSLTEEEKKALLKIARHTLENYLKEGKIPEFKVDSEKLKEKRGVFVTLKNSELKDIEIEISVLSPFEKVKSLDEIVVGRDGLMIQRGFYSGLLLPQVPTEYGWDKKTYLEHLCLKAGLPPTAYNDEDVTIYKFTALVFSEKEFSP